MYDHEFRVWCKDRKEWETHGTCLRSDGQILHLDKGKIMPLGPKNHIIQQYIGLKDIEHEKLYKGDIVQCFNFEDDYYCRHVVDFHNGAFGYWIKHQGFISFAENKNFEWKDTRSDRIRKVGNVFENPELVVEVNPNE